MIIVRSDNESTDNVTVEVHVESQEQLLIEFVSVMECVAYKLDLTSEQLKNLAEGACSKNGEDIVVEREDLEHE